ADELTVFHARARIVDEIGHAARRIDPIVRTAGGAGFRLDDLDAVVERLLDDDDAREAGVGRAVGDVEFHVHLFIQAHAGHLALSRMASAASRASTAIFAGSNAVNLPPRRSTRPSTMTVSTFAGMANDTIAS